MIKEVCGFCGDSVEDCIDAGECNAGIVGYEDDTCAFCNGSCRCDYNYDMTREQQLEYDRLEHERLDEKRNEEEQDYGDDD